MTDRFRETAFPLWMKCGLAAIILLLISGGVWFFMDQQTQQQQEMEMNLTAIARLKADQIAAWREDQRVDAELLVQNPSLIEAVTRFRADPEGDSAQRLLAVLRQIQKEHDYADLLLLDPEGMMRLCVKANTHDHSDYASALSTALRNGMPVFTDLRTGVNNSTPHISVITPIFGDKHRTGNPIGGLVLICDATQFLYPLIQFWPRPRRSAETLLVRRDGDEVLYLNELRHKKGTALKLRIPLSQSDLPAAMAVQGNEGIVKGTDYRGIEVVAAILPIPDSSWFMLAKVDAAEIYAEWRFRSLMILGLMLGVLLLLSAVGLILWQRNLKAHYRDLYRSEALLRASMEKEAVTLKAIGDALIATDATGRVELMNPVAETLTGWNQKEARGKTLSEVFHIINEETRHPVADPVAQVLKEGRVVGLANHTLLLARDGREIPIADSGAPIRDDTGQVVGVVLVFRDQSEERLNRRLAETRLSLIGYALDHTLDDLLTRALDEVGAFVDSPISFYHFVEPDQKTLSLQQWSTRTLKDFCRAEGKGTHYSIDRAGVWVDCVHQRKPVIHNDYASLPHKKGLPEGHAQVVRELVVPVMRGGELVAILGVGNKPTDYTQNDEENVSYLADVTWEIVRHKRAEEALHQSEQRFRRLYEESASPYQSLDEEGHIIEVNTAWLEELGYRREEVIGRWFGDFLAGDGPTLFSNSFIEFKRQGHVSGLEFEMKRKDGEIIATLFGGRVGHDEMGRFLQTHCVFANITERKRAEEAHRQLQDQLVQAQKMESVGRLAGGVAHDFNNMLAVILGRTEMMLMKMNPGDPLYSNLEQIQKVANRSADLTRQLLAFARKQTIAPKLLDLNETVEGMLKMLRRLIGEDIDLSWQPGTGLWPMKMDPAQVDQILANLCINARDAISKTGKLIIETRNVVLDESYCSKHAGFVIGEYVMLAVSDTGCGMKRETLENIFDPFFTTKEVGKGTGLGLSTVYGIVKQNAGFINVYSEPEKGTTFRIYLPRHKGEAESEPRDSLEKLPMGSGETVLLVEDDAEILDIGKAMLESLGYSVHAANSPDDALGVARRHPGRIHLLMTDVVMPQMSGKDLAVRLTEKRPGTKTLFMSGYTADVIAHHGVLDKGIRFIQKPFSMHDLAVRVREALGIEG
ncbi:MAG: PAS domain S-box protein [Deltaproteobacteria bacterium]|nr:PAS domain S-box protein [Deltaproteobacteria bacterium]